MASGLRGILTAFACAALAAGTLSAAQQPGDAPPIKDSERRPRLTVRAQPLVALTPARVVFTAELIGGVNDFEDYYCPTVVWEWGDDTTSESTFDCEPFLAGKSEIRRRFTVEHTYRRSGAYKVFFKLKRRDKTVATGSVSVQIRPGVRDF